MDAILKLFWKLECLPHSNSVSSDDQYCGEYFLKTIKQDTSQNFIVLLPFCKADPTFVNSREMALNRFLSFERRLLKQPPVHNQYIEFMTEYLELNHMEIVRATQPATPFMYYIPHHCIMRSNNSSAKLRVVFDASAKTKNNLSLNDCLYKGPKLQNDILTILSKFRLHRYVLCVDMKQMYRNIVLDTNQCNYQRIIWRFDPSEAPQGYPLKTVTYGVYSAPFSSSSAPVSS